MDRPTIDVRRARTQDLAPLLGLVEGYWSFEDLPGFDPKAIGAQLERLIGDPKLGAVLVAQASGELVGYLLLVYVFSLEHKGLTAEIDEFFVSPAVRSCSAGAALLSAARSAATHSGCTNLSLQLGQGNHRARDFHLRHGFEERSGYELLDLALSAPCPENSPGR